MKLEPLIRTIPDYPKPGIQFRDITTMIGDAKGLAFAVESLTKRFSSEPPDLVAGIEARGFIFGPPIAMGLGVGFVPLRKPGKLPGDTLGRDFELEYGRDRIELHVGAIEPGQRVLVVDDLIATGGTAAAAVELVRDAGGIVEACAFVVALPDLGGISRLEALGCDVHWISSFEGD